MSGFGSKFFRPEKDQRHHIGRAAACRVCNPGTGQGPDGPGCACIAGCGAPGCTGALENFRQEVPMRPLAPRKVSPERPPTAAQAAYYERGTRMTPPEYRGPRGQVD